MLKGFTIVEVLVAIFIVTIGLGGVIAFIQFSTFTTLNVDLELTAAYLAQEGLEAVRQIRDSNFLEIHRCQPSGTCGTWQNNRLTETDCGGGCQIACKTAVTYYPLCGSTGANVDIELVTTDEFLRLVDGGYYTYDPSGALSPFKRKITINEEPGGPGDQACPLGDCIAVSVKIEWNTPRSQGDVIAETLLYNWLPLSP